MSLVEVALWRDLVTPFPANERYMQLASGPAEPRARCDLPDVNGSAERARNTRRRRVGAEQPTALHPAQLTCIEGRFVSGSDWSGARPPLLMGTAGFAHLEQRWRRSCPTRKSSLERSSIVEIVRHPSCGKSRIYGTMESVEEYTSSRLGRCQTKDPHPPTAATVGTCYPVVDSSGATPEHQHPAIV